MTDNPNLRALIAYLETTRTIIRGVDTRLEAAIRTAKGLAPYEPAEEQNDGEAFRDRNPT
jgi:hypothetical protein